MGFLAVFGTTEIREVPGFIDWSGRRGSNPRPRPWQGRALPLSYTRIREIGGDLSPAMGRAMPNAARECNRPRGDREQARSTGHNCAIGPQISPKAPGRVPPIANWAVKRQLGLGHAKIDPVLHT